MKLLKSIPSIQAAYQLHKNAATAAELNTDSALIANKDAAGGELIRVKVAPDGSKFTVWLGENGPEKTFETLILVGPDHFAARPGRQGGEGRWVDGLLHEADRAVAEQEIAPARVQAPIAARARLAIVGDLDSGGRTVLPV